MKYFGKTFRCQYQLLSVTGLSLLFSRKVYTARRRCRSGCGKWGFINGSGIRAWKHKSHTVPDLRAYNEITAVEITKAWKITSETWSFSCTRRVFDKFER